MPKRGSGYNRAISLSESLVVIYDLSVEAFLMPFTAPEVFNVTFTVSDPPGPPWCPPASLPTICAPVQVHQW